MLRSICAALVLIVAAKHLRAQPKNNAPVPDARPAFLTIPLPDNSLPLPSPTKPSPEEQDAFGKRLDLQLRAWLAWVDAIVSLTGDQRNEITARIDELVETERAQYGESFRRTRLLPFPDDFPYLLHLKDRSFNLRTVLHFNMLQDRLALRILTPEALEQLKTSGQELVQFRRRAFREFVLARMDASLGLTDQQMSLVRVDLQNFDGYFDTPFISAGQSSHFTAMTVLPLVRTETRGILTAGQLKLLGQGGRDELSVGFQLGLKNLKFWQEDLRQTALQLRDNIYDHFRHQIEQLEATRDAPEGAGGQLRTAAKGAAISLAEDWEANVAQTASVMAARLEQIVILPLDQNISLGGSVTWERAEQQPLWSAELKKFLENSTIKVVAADRLEMQRAARAGAVLAMLDEELWLTPQQRDQLLAHFTRVLKEHQPLFQGDENFSLIGDMAIPLHCISLQDRGTILNPAQEAVWSKLTSYFEFQSIQNGVQATSRGPDQSMEWGWRVVKDDM